MSSPTRQFVRGGISLACCLGGAFIGYAASPANGHIPKLPHVIWGHTMAGCLLGGAVPCLAAWYFAPSNPRRLISIEFAVSLSMFLLLTVRLPFAIQEGKVIRGRFRDKVNSTFLVAPHRDVETPDLPAGEQASDGG